VPSPGCAVLWLVRRKKKLAKISYIFSYSNFLINSLSLGKRPPDPGGGMIQKMQWRYSSRYEGIHYPGSSGGGIRPSLKCVNTRLLSSIGLRYRNQARFRRESRPRGEVAHCAFPKQPQLVCDAFPWHPTVF
jgi:hypothetical protein